MNYTKAEREHIKKSISPSFFESLENSYHHFINWFHNDTIDREHKECLIDSMLLTATPSVLHPQYIRLEMIEYWKERFSEYPTVVEKLNNIV